MAEQVHNPSDPKEQVMSLAGTVAANAVAGEDIYAHLFDPNAPDPGYTVEDAAVRPTIPGQTSARLGYWKKPDAAQIARAADFGFDLTQQAKYYPDEPSNK